MEIGTGFECGIAGPDGLTSGAGSWLTGGGDRPAAPHQVPVTLSGGRQFYLSNNNDTMSVTACAEGYFGAAIAIPATNQNSNRNLVIWRYGATTIGSIQWQGSDGRIFLYSGTTFRAGTVMTAMYADKTWRWVNVHVLVADALGVIELRINEQQLAVYVGDTKPGADTAFNTLQLAYDTCYDDFVWNSTHYVICYDGGVTPANVPVVGNTVTGAVSTATAVVRAYVGDGTSGYIIVDTIGGGGAWQNGEGVTDTGTFSATTSSALLADNRSWPNETYFGLYKADGAGAAAAWTPTGGGGLNYACIDEVPPATFPDTTDYVNTGVAGNVDTYTYTDLPADALAVVDCRMHAYAKREDATLSRVRLQGRTGGVTYDGPGLAQTASYAWYKAMVPVDDTGTVWTPAAWNAAEFGVKSSA
jgi:hypothetical protein